MSWVRFVPGFSRHPKRLKSGPISSWLWVCSVDHCMEYLTDGFLDEAAIPGLCSTIVGPALKRATENLVAIGSWEKVPGGYLVHNYLKHNLSRAQVESDRETARQRHQRWKGARNAVPTPVDNGVTTPVTHAETTPLATPVATPLETRLQRRSNAAAVGRAVGRSDQKQETVEPVDNVDNSRLTPATPDPTRVPTSTMAHAMKSDSTSGEITLSAEELAGIQATAQAAGVTLAQAKAELVAAKLRAVERNQRART